MNEIFLQHSSLRQAGCSFGGPVATLLAAELGARVRDLVLIGVAALGLKSGPRAPFAKERTGMSAEERTGVHRHNLAVLMFLDPAKIDALAVHLPSREYPACPLPQPAFAAADELARTLAEVAVPLKTIWGTRDAIARPSLEHGSPSCAGIIRSWTPGWSRAPATGVMYEADEFCAALLDLLGTGP